MPEFLTYFALTLMIMLVLSGTIARYTNYRLVRYIQNHYPEMAVEFGYKKRSYFNEFKLLISLWKTQDIEDSELVKLKTNAKMAHILSLSIFMAICVFIIIVAITTMFF